MNKPIIWDAPYYYSGSTRFIPEPSINMKEIYLEGHTQSDLNWTHAVKTAEKIIESGQKILWQMDLKLFSTQNFSLNNSQFFQSLCLALTHFRDGLWKQFSDYSLGLSLYQGSPDFSQFFVWSEAWRQQYQEWIQGLEIHEPDHDLSRRFFCRNVFAEYFYLLARQLPDTIPCYVSFDCSSIPNPLDQLQMLYPECWEGLNFYLTHSSLPLISLGKDAPNSSLGICLPAIENFFPKKQAKLESLLKLLIESQAPFRIISEGHLTAQWEGLDLLIYDEALLSMPGKRLLQGFQAAGGKVIPLGGPEYQSWMEKFLV